MWEGGNSGIRRKRGCGGGRGQNPEAVHFVESDCVSALRWWELSKYFGGGVQ